MIFKFLQLYIFLESNKTCLDNQFQCNNSYRCIDMSWTCDFTDDCEDGSDESLDRCKAPELKCDDSTEFRCSDGKRCVKRRYQCDGEFDCQDKSDETECGIYIFQIFCILIDS